MQTSKVALAKSSTKEYLTNQAANNMTESIYTFTEDFDVTPSVQADFDKNGYIIVRSLFDTEEVTLLKDALESDEGIIRYAFGRDDGEGGKIRMVLWNQPGNDITGVMARCEKIAGTMEKLLGGEVYHYHAKLIMKDARTGGAFVWHQDYGYWYENGCIFPDMGTVSIALDKATQENGCLKVIPGSHRIGRIDHVLVGHQMGADVERVTEIQKFLPLVHVELEPGDALFFHCNLLHRSEQNHSDKRRWAFLVAYNRASNNPVIEHHHSRYVPMAKVPNSAIKMCTTTTDLTGKEFSDPATEDIKKVTEKTQR
ncbi:L-proline trans-4-hydroxylase-like isoform X2 [Branchiostoma floridae x Branchiostoma japonicum]